MEIRVEENHLESKRPSLEIGTFSGAQQTLKAGTADFHSTIARFCFLFSEFFFSYA
jgi:hypothetical protein